MGTSLGWFPAVVWSRSWPSIGAILARLPTAIFFALQKWRQIEAVNGAWAVIGVTLAFAGEAVFSTGILGQVTGCMPVCHDYLVLDSAAYTCRELNTYA